MKVRYALGLLVVFIVSACSDVPEQGVTSPRVPTVAANYSAAAACNAETASIARDQIDRLFDNSVGTWVQDHALILWSAVETECASASAPANAPNVMLSYVQFTIDMLRAGNAQTPAAGTAADSLVKHWNAAFAYVGYDPPNLGADVFGREGAVGVVPANLPLGQRREIAAANAALTMYSQTESGDPRGHLFAIAPIPGGCLGATNLRQTGPCFEFSAFPTVSPVFNPGVKVGVCQPIGGNDGRRPALGHLTLGLVEIPQQAAYPTSCADVGNPAPALSWNSGVSGVAKRVAWLAKRAFTPQPLYAVHGGLGGVGESLSPFGGVDLMVFEAGLKNETLGALPASPDAGSWSSQITKPGKIYTQLGLGAYPDTVIVINQAGGNCGLKCGGILLQANLFSAVTSGATSGRYDITWVSVQDKPTVKDAAFVVRGTTGEIARLSYRSTSSRDELFYNGLRVGNWSRQVPQRFVIRVDLKEKKTSLWFGAIGVAPAPVTPAIPFVNAGANLTQLAADFRGSDSGVMGWAEIALQRIPDR